LLEEEEWGDPVRELSERKAKGFHGDIRFAMSAEFLETLRVRAKHNVVAV
jgi:hypothetical protein